MAEKNKTISFRVTEDKFEDLKDVADEEDLSLSDLMRGRADNVLEVYRISDETDSSTTDLFDSHVDALVEDDDYRELVDEFYQDERDFKSFVKEEDYFETKWVDETAVDYDRMLEEFESVVSDAQRGKVDDDYFDEAYDTIDELRDQGYEREAFLLNTVVEKFQE